MSVSIVKTPHILRISVPVAAKFAKANITHIFWNRPDYKPKDKTKDSYLIMPANKESLNEAYAVDKKHWMILVVMKSRREHREVAVNSK